MAKTVPSVTIKNGTGSIPVVGLGTWTVLGQQVSLTGLHKFIYHKMLKSAYEPLNIEVICRTCTPHIFI